MHRRTPIENVARCRPFGAYIWEATRKDAQGNGRNKPKQICITVWPLWPQWAQARWIKWGLRWPNDWSWQQMRVTQRLPWIGVQMEKKISSIPGRVFSTSSTQSGKMQMLSHRVTQSRVFGSYGRHSGTKTGTTDR